MGESLLIDSHIETQLYTFFVSQVQSGDQISVRIPLRVLVQLCDGYQGYL